MDKKNFESVVPNRSCNIQKDMPMVILGNKGDMVHLRQVSSEEGNI